MVAYAARLDDVAACPEDFGVLFWILSAHIDLYWHFSAFEDLKIRSYLEVSKPGRFPSRSADDEPFFFAVTMCIISGVRTNSVEGNS